LQFKVRLKVIEVVCKTSLSAGGVECAAETAAAKGFAQGLSTQPTASAHANCCISCKSQEHWGVVDVGFGSAGWCSRASSDSCRGVCSCCSGTRAHIVGDADGLAPVERGRRTFESAVDPCSARAHWPLQRRFRRLATWQPHDGIALAPSGPIRRVFKALRQDVLIEVGGFGSYITAGIRSAW